MSSLTTEHCRSDADGAALSIKGELVDIHLAGGDYLYILFRQDHPII